MKSGIADMLNTGPMQPKGGAITAALFLKQFVDEKVQWMHIDIAGTVWSHKKRSATGFGVATLVEWPSGFSRTRRPEEILFNAPHFEG
ncbi:unnamed protein product [Urochloa humidicola]